MACWDSYEVVDSQGMHLGSTAPHGWGGCGSCSYCYRGEETPYVEYTPAVRKALADAGYIARWLNDELYHSRMTEEQAYDVLDMLHPVSE